jgi:cytochrome c-type biogenesis protein CcmH/NrfG
VHRERAQRETHQGVATLGAVSSLATASGAAESRPDGTTLSRRLPRLGITGDALLGFVLAGALAALAFLTTGGTSLGPNTWVQIALTTIAAALAATVALIGGKGRAWGGVTLLLFAGVAALTFASIAWSVQPATAWLEANRTLSYLAAFAAGMAVARLAPARYPALLGAIATAATVLAGYALVVKVFPASLDPNDAVARLRAPFGYWNAAGLIAAMGVPGCMWAGARRDGGWILRALSVPAIAVLIVVMILSWSRGALVGAILGLACWFALEPVRLRSALVLALGAAGAAAPAAWALGTRGIAHDRMPLHTRVVAGHQLGVALLIMLAMLVVVGVVAARAVDRFAVPERTRRRIGGVLIALLGLLPIIGVIALATSTRGFTGEISHAWKTLTNPNAVVYETPSRLGQLGSSRPRYWREGVLVGEHALLKGVGARGFGTAWTRYSSDPLHVGDAHSYVIETFADFGLIGVALSLALLVAWAVAARRALLASAARARERLAERAGLSALLVTSVIFGFSSAIDWTWFVPGVAVPAMLCAGWLAGRGPLAQAIGRARPRFGPGVGAVIVGLVALAFAAGWFIWQPLRSADEDASAISEMLAGHGAAALVDARTAAASDPVSADALSTLSAVYAGLGDLTAARAELVKATSVQAGNPATWIALAQFDLHHGQPADALRALHAALRLDPHSTQTRMMIAQASSA